MKIFGFTLERTAQPKCKPEFLEHDWDKWSVCTEDHCGLCACTRNNDTNDQRRSCRRCGFTQEVRI